MKKAIVFEASREGYGIDQIREPLTVGDLMAFLEDVDPDRIVILIHDRGYTYGTLRLDEVSFKYSTEGDYGEEWEEDEEY